jgi:hypothetical protein
VIFLGSSGAQALQRFAKSSCTLLKESSQPALLCNLRSKWWRTKGGSHLFTQGVQTKVQAMRVNEHFLTPC